MRIRQLLERIPELIPADGLPDMELSGVTCDSRQVRPGFLYAAIPGVNSDGHTFLGQAAANGAAAAVVSRADAVFPGPVLRTCDPRGAYARIEREFAGCPDRDLCMLGVTGTNGKTTTAYLMAALAGTRSPGGLLSTIEVRTPGTRHESGCTTPDPGNFFRLAGQIRDEGGKFLAMELSSHSLDQRRTAGVRFQAAVFTNLTGDHLDYHKTMENYFAAKCRLFTEQLAGRAVINTDDPYGRRLADMLKDREVVTFGMAEDADCRITDVTPSVTGTGCNMVYRGRVYPVRTKMPGVHNLHNLAGAMLACEVFGIPFGTVPDVVVPGRLQPAAPGLGKAAYLVDYAHTDDALEQVLKALRPLTRGRLITLFGCGGDRDRTKRPRMGRAAAQGSDLVIVTSDNPRSEDPAAIIAEILPGIPAGTDFRVEPDRRKAIELAVSLAGNGDVVLFAGKGHETYQEIRGIRNHFSDAEEILNALKGR